MRRRATKRSTKNDLVLQGVSLDGEDLSRRSYSFFAASDSMFHRCNFRKSKFAEACFGTGTNASEYVDCSFDGSRITASAPGRARFIRCSFRECVIHEFFGRHVEFVECVFSGRINKAIFFGRSPDNQSEIPMVHEFRGNDFRGAELIDVSFRHGIDLREQMLPEGDQYTYVVDAAEAVARARRDVTGWSDLEERRKAIVVLKVYEHALAGGQEQLFINRNSLPRDFRSATDRILMLLRDSPRSGDNLKGTAETRGHEHE